MSDPAPAPRLLGPVAVVIPQFPSVAGAALLREAEALEREGVPVLLAALERGPRLDTGRVPQEAEPWIERAFMMRRVSPAVLGANLLILARRPHRWLGTLARLAWDARRSPARIAEVLALYLGAVDLGVRLRARSVRHVHAQDAGASALVARVISRVHARRADLPASVTVLGPDVAPHAAGLRARLAGASFLRCCSQDAAASLAAALAPAAPSAPVLTIPREPSAGDAPRAGLDAATGAARLADELERAGLSLEPGADPDAPAALADETADVAREAAALTSPGSRRAGVVRASRDEEAVAVELRLEPRGPAGLTRAIARHRLRGTTGSPIPETRALEALAAGLAKVQDARAHPPLPRALAADRALGLEVISCAEGAELTRFLRRGRWHRGDPDAAMALAGAWLARFERIPLPDGDSAARDREAILARLLHEAEADARRCVELGLAEPLVDRALQACRRELRESTGAATCWTHGSFVPGHVVITGVDEMFRELERRRAPAEGGSATGVALGSLRPGFPGEDAALMLECLAIVVPGLASAGLLRARRHELEGAFLAGRQGWAPTAPTDALRAAKLLAVGARFGGLSEHAGRRGHRARASFLRLRLSARILELTT